MTKVNVTYRGYCGKADDELDLLAFAFQGRETGAGYGSGIRDIDFEFPTPVQAKGFKQAVMDQKATNPALTTVIGATIKE